MNNLVCSRCEKKFSLNDRIWRCECGGSLDIHFEGQFPIDDIKKRKHTLWRYREAIPIQNDSNIISFDEGFTPLLKMDFGGKLIFIKQDYLFPTGSFKDRGAAVLISKMKELGVKKVVEDSSGNAGCAVAAYCARAYIDCEIFVPESTVPGKLTQIQLYGAHLNRIPGSREDTAHAAIKAAEKNYYASHYWNPFFIHGTKTFAFEVCEQLEWRSPDSVVLPIGNGSLLLGAYTGFNELLSAHIIDRLPRFIGIQSEGCAPVAEAFKKNLNEIPTIDKKKTIAEGIAIAEPTRGLQILEAVRKTGGEVITVNDSEIIRSLTEMCKRGFFMEPTSAATIAGMKKYLKKSTTAEKIVSTITGHGLKTTEKMAMLLNE